jgi:phosphocarrier protein HPr
MLKATMKLKNETGLHARPASMFVKEAMKYQSEIIVVKDDKQYNGKSIMSILSMGAGKDEKIAIITKGEDEKEAIESLKEIINSNFKERAEEE